MFAVVVRRPKSVASTSNKDLNMRHLKSAYLIVICNGDTNAIEEVTIWSTPEWEQALVLKGKMVYVAYQIKMPTFSQAAVALLKDISKVNSRYQHLYARMDPQEVKAWMSYEHVN